MDIVTQDQQTLECELLADIGQTVEDSNGHSGTEPTDATVSGTYRQWTGSRRQQWTK
jgi:hypothetical protein